MSSVPDGDPRVADARELLFARLDLDGAGADLHPVEPIIPAADLGLVEAWAFERTEPFVHFSFYLYENSAQGDAAFDRFWADGSELRARLPEGVEIAGGTSSGRYAIAYYYPDGSRGDPQLADRILTEVLQRTAGYE